LWRVLLLLDADELESAGGCVRDAARSLAEEARKAGAGTRFSVAIVFLRKEYESLLVASYRHLPGCRSEVAIPSDVEESPRDAKGWLKRNLEDGYKPTQDHAALTRHINIELLRSLNVRCFRRLEHALEELATAFSTGKHFVSPVPGQPS
jgi:hypothetical protein